MRIRINLNIEAESHPELYKELSRTPVKDRAERVRFLAGVGVLLGTGGFQKKVLEGEYLNEKTEFKPGGEEQAEEKENFDGKEKSELLDDLEQLGL